jgi:anti-sigma factor RsiW
MADRIGSPGPDEHADFEALAAGYALHSLEPEDEQRLSAHLMTCPHCARIVADTASLGAAFAELLDAEPPPPGLRDRILAAATAEPRPLRGSAGQTPIAGMDPAPAPARPVLPAPSTVPRRRRMLRERAAIAVLAAAIGVAVAVPVTLAASHQGTSTGNTALAQWLLKPNAREMTLKPTSGAGRAKVVVTDQGAYLLAEGLPANRQSDTTYVLWAADSARQLRAVATFDVHNPAPVQLTAAKLPYGPAQISGMAISFEHGRTAPAHPTDIVLTSA